MRFTSVQPLKQNPSLLGADSFKGLPHDDDRGLELTCSKHFADVEQDMHATSGGTEPRAMHNFPKRRKIGLCALVT